VCLIFFSIQQHPTYKLIVAGNRDEFYNRKTAAANYWSDYPQVLGGRDLEAMGTWLGMTKSGKLSMLTNYRDPQNINPAAPSRGQLVSDYLLEDVSPKDYLTNIEKKGKLYNGFNLLAGTPDEFWYYSNYKDGVTSIAPGFYGISNHLLETPWPKVLRGKEKLKSILTKSKLEADELFNLLYDDARAPQHQLPNTGLPPDREEALSSMFIKTENYGTRCSTVILVDYDHHVTFSERVYDTTTFQFATQTFQFTTEG